MNLKKYFIQNHLMIIASASLAIILSIECSQRVEIKREWPMPLKIDPAIIKQCNLIHNSTCPEKSGKMTEATYIFDRRKLLLIEAEIQKNEPNIVKGSDYEAVLFEKVIESSSAYSATFIRTECSIEYYVKGENVTCERFLNYINELRKECGDCIDIIKIGPRGETKRYSRESNEGLFFQ